MFKYCIIVYLNMIYYIIYSVVIFYITFYFLMGNFSLKNIL